MEETPSDKIIREKLQAAQYPFDPAAWADMEKMLDGKKKRRGIIWWSTLGVAATLLLSAGIYTGIYLHSQSAKTETHASNQSAKTANSQYNNAPVFSSSATSQNQSSDLVNGANTINTTTITSNKTNTSSTSHDHKAVNNARNTTLSAYQQTASTEQPIIAARATFSFSEIELAPEPIKAVKYTCLYDDLEDGTPIIPDKLRRKSKITYKIGIESGVYEGYVKGTFSDRPTWTLGLSQELGIGKYFAITNSILYSEVNFKVNNPDYPSNNYGYPDNYRSHIREVAIPIGIKVYPYSNKFFRVGLGISYISHIKLKETFDYKLHPIQNTSSFADAGTFFPVTNDFGSGDPTKTITTATPPHTSPLPEYYSLGNAKRYYGSLAYTAGIEIELPLHLSIAAEPCFMMSLEKIKMQNSRVFDFGMNTGIKYAF